MLYTKNISPPLPVGMPMIDVDAEHLKNYARTHAGSDSDREDPLEAGDEAVTALDTAGTAKTSNMADTAATNEPMDSVAGPLKRGEADSPVLPGSPKKQRVGDDQPTTPKDDRMDPSSERAPKDSEAWGFPRSTTNASGYKYWPWSLRTWRCTSEIWFQQRWCRTHGKVWTGVLWWSVSSWRWSKFNGRCQHGQDHGATYISSFCKRTRAQCRRAFATGCIGRPAWISKAWTSAGSAKPWCCATYCKSVEHSLCAHLARKAQLKGRNNLVEEIEVRCSWVCLVGAWKRKLVQSSVWQHHTQNFCLQFCWKDAKRKTWWWPAWMFEMLFWLWSRKETPWSIQQMQVELHVAMLWGRCCLDSATEVCCGIVQLPTFWSQSLTWRSTPHTLAFWHQKMDLAW